MKLNQVRISASRDVIPFKSINHLHDLFVLKQSFVRGAILFFDIFLEVVL